MSAKVVVIVEPNELKKVTPDFTFPPEMTNKIQYPMSPMTSAEEFVDDDGMTKVSVRVTVFIDSRNAIPPMGKFEYRAESQELCVTVTYNYHQESDPLVFACWYVEFHSNQHEYPASTVVTTLENEDPKTSRGTVTVVQQGRN